MVKTMSEGEYQAALSEAFAKWHAAPDWNLNEKARLSQNISRLQQAKGG